MDTGSEDVPGGGLHNETQSKTRVVQQKLKAPFTRAKKPCKEDLK
jgi:hypothetical protein